MFGWHPSQIAPDKEREERGGSESLREKVEREREREREREGGRERRERGVRERE